MVDNKKDVLLTNDKTRELLDLPADLVKSGSPLSEISKFQLQRGDTDERGKSVGARLPQMPRTDGTDTKGNCGTWSRLFHRKDN